MAVLKEIGAASLAKFYGIYMLMLGFLLSLVLLMIPVPGIPGILVILLPGILAISGLISGFVNAVIYNGMAVNTGGVEFTLQDDTIKSINPISFAKMYCVISAFWGLAAGSMLGFIVYAIIGFITAILVGYLYNIISVRIGGIKIKMDKNVLNGIEWYSMSKVAAIILAALAFVLVMFAVLLSLFLPGYFQAPSSATIESSVGVLFGTGLLVTIFALIFGFISTALEVDFYDYLASNIKGLELYVN